MTSNPFRLLVVDDDPSIRQMLLIGLRQEGYLVETGAWRGSSEYYPHI